MKAKHRHELKTNQLADWLGNLPEWASENKNWLIGSAVVIIAAVGLYLWKVDLHDAGLFQKRLDLTMAVNNVYQGKAQLISKQSSGTDASYLLIQPAEKLGALAQGESNANMAALAYIKQGETIRAEMQYRLTGLTSDVIKTQTELARKAYAAALARKPSLTALEAAARLGLGLCDEEEGNFDSARKIYTELVNDKKLDGTAGAAAAEIRLETMADYKTPVKFLPAPFKPKPQVKVIGSDPNKVSVEDIKKFIQDSNSTPVKQAADANTVIKITPSPSDTNSVKVETPTAPIETKPAEANQPAATTAPAEKPAEKPIDPNVR